MSSFAMPAILLSASCPTLQDGRMIHEKLKSKKKVDSRDQNLGKRWNFDSFKALDWAVFESTHETSRAGIHDVNGQSDTSMARRD